MSNPRVRFQKHNNLVSLLSGIFIFEQCSRPRFSTQTSPSGGVSSQVYPKIYGNSKTEEWNYQYLIASQLNNSSQLAVRDNSMVTKLGNHLTGNNCSHTEVYCRNPLSNLLFPLYFYSSEELQFIYITYGSLVPLRGPF